MSLVDDGVLPWNVRPAVRAPGEGLVEHDRLGHSARIVAAVEREVGARVTGAIAEMRIAPDQPAGQLLGIRVDQELVRVESQTPFGLIRSVHAVAIELAGDHVGEVAMPDVFRALRQCQALKLAAALAVEQAELDLGGIGGK